MNERSKIIDELKESAPGLPFPGPATPYKSPEGYFERLPEQLMNRVANPSAKKIVTLSFKSWTTLAAAAAITGVIIGSVILIGGYNNDISDDPQGWVKKEVHSISDDKLNHFLEVTNAIDTLSETTEEIAMNKKDIASLTADISSEEIMSLLQDFEHSNNNNSQSENP